MSDKGKQNEKKKPGVSSDHTTPAKAKRPFKEVANSSAEEIVLLSHQIEELATELRAVGSSVNDLRAKTEDAMTKGDMKTFIKATVQDIMTEINKNIEVTIDIKVQERTKKWQEEIDMLREENDQLKLKLININKNSLSFQKTANLALEKANYNEQYSRKNNIKIMNIREEAGEDDSTLLNKVTDLLGKQDITLSPHQVIAIHRIPGKPGSPKPVLMKVTNTTVKSTIMRKRKVMKSAGHRLVDDVTRLNTELITRLFDHPAIEAAWYFNRSVYGKTTAGRRIKFVLHDDIDDTIKRSKILK